ncbi:LysR family transcriptional regulator [Vibrio sp. SCSIO 43136]|uniref:LysR family transcriptional regulator n=1 Tax=Vibrio sp. SCSIO 43136 TaxID=2819101 RepID=UPI002074EF50|nr:LysR family transcriptional regulator [Vibrio sp. SCSIO 43136]USD68041.1 LysR family transcriptional regulator [Vibrio sp. SCSIO 43136]
MNWKSIAFDWNRTRAFLATAELGSLSAAAKSLGMTQPTLSRQVAALEDELGIALFERSGQRLKLTSGGIELFNIAREMGDVAHKFSMVANGQAQTLEGKVVISVCQVDGIYRLPAILNRLRKAEPNINVELIVTNEVSDLRRRDADIAIRSFKPTQDSLIVKKLGDEKIHLYGTKEYLSLFSNTQSPKGNEQIQIIGFGHNDVIAKQFSEFGWQLSDDNFRISTEFQATQIALCKQGLGLIYLPQDVARQEPLLERALPNLTPSLKLPLWLVCHEELRTNLRVRRVFDFLAAEMSQYLASNSA